MSIFNIIGGGTSDVEVVAKGTSEPTTGPRVEMPIEISEYKVGDILFVQRTETTTQGNHIYGVYLYITANTGEALGIGAARMGASRGQIAHAYLDSTENNIRIRSSSHGSYLARSSSSYAFSGTYNVLLLRPTT